MQSGRILTGFDDPVHQSQQVFRRVLGAMSRPGSIHELERSMHAAPGLSPAATAVCLTLLDFATPLWLDEDASAAQAFFVFHCNVPVVRRPGDASIGIIGRALHLGDLQRFHLGSDECPENAATLVLEVDRLVPDSGMWLAGPGIDGRIALRVDGVAKGFWQQLAANRASFPRGIDLLLTCGQCIAALPRSVRVVGEV